MNKITNEILIVQLRLALSIFLFWVVYKVMSYKEEIIKLDPFLNMFIVITLIIIIILGIANIFHLVLGWVEDD